MRIGLIFLLVFSSFILYGQNSRIWATYYGGSGSENEDAVAIDASGNVFLAGQTNSATGIASGGFQNTIGGADDGYLVKFDAAGNRLWATYYGGSGAEYACAVATDVAGNVFISGFTNSQSNIASGGFQNTFGGGSIDAFLVKFDPSGNRLWATYYGGSGMDFSWSLSTDAAGNVYMAGNTNSQAGMASGGFQNTIGGAQDAYLVKFDPLGNRLWATYYGGTGDEQAYSAATDATGNIYLSGFTDSPSGIASGGFQNSFSGAYDAMLIKFSSAGARLWGTYYGGPGSEDGICIATDPFGNIYLGGGTSSASGIASGGFQNTYSGGTTYDAFLVKFSSAGARVWATYYGGSLQDDSFAVITDGAGNVFLAGNTYSSNAIASGGFQNNLIGIQDQFLVKFDPAGGRLCATYYGQEDQYEEYGTMAVDNAGNVYMSAMSASPTGIASGGFQNVFAGGGTDAYLVKFTSCFNNILNVNVVPSHNPCNAQCVGTATVTPANGSAPYTYVWSNSQSGSVATGLCAGNYSVTVTDGVGSTAVANVVITQPAVLTASGTATSASCGNSNGTATVTASGGTPGYTYSWNNGQTTAVASGLLAGNYTAVITDANGCTQSQTVSVSSAGSFSLIINSTQSGCAGPTGTASAIVGNGTPPYSYAWSNGQTGSSATGLAAGSYSVVVIDANGCTSSATATVSSAQGVTAVVSASPVSISSGANSVLAASGGGTYLWNTGATDASISVTPTATTEYCVTVTDTNGCTDSVCITVYVEVPETPCGQLYIPNAFSPNSDLENDRECVFGNCIESMHIIIYSRWGEKVFESSDQSICWDGTFRNVPLDAAVFTYHLQAVLTSGEKIHKKGNISLIR